MAAQQQTITPSPPPAASPLSRPPSAHPQLRLPLSHHGLPRGPTSPENSYSSRSHRYEPLTKDGDAASERRYSSASSSNRSSTTSYSARDKAHFFRLSVATTGAPPSPPVTPFSPSAFPSEATAMTPMGAVLSSSSSAAGAEESQQCCPRCRCSLAVQPPAADHQRPEEKQLNRSRSLDEVPSPVRRQMSTLSVGGSKEEPSRAPQRHLSQQQQDPLPQFQSSVSLTPPSSSSSSSFAKFGKKIKAKLGGPRKSEDDPRRSSGGSSHRKSSRRDDYYYGEEEVEDVHWTEM